MVSIPSPEQAFTLLGTNKALLSRWFFLFPMWDMLVPWKVGEISFAGHIWIYLGSVGSVCHVGSASGWPAGPSSMIAWIFLPWTCWCRAVGLDIINIRSVELDYITGWNWNLENIELTLLPILKPYPMEPSYIFQLFEASCSLTFNKKILPVTGYINTVHPSTNRSCHDWNNFLAKNKRTVLLMEEILHQLICIICRVYISQVVSRISYQQYVPPSKYPPWNPTANLCLKIRPWITPKRIWIFSQSPLFRGELLGF